MALSASQPLLRVDGYLTVMETPFGSGPDDLLRAVRTPSRQEVRRSARRGRCTAGAGRPGYLDEPGVVPEPVLAAWEEGAVRIEEYPAGSSGPDSGNERSDRASS